MNKPDYSKYVCPCPDADVDMLQLAIDVKTLQGTIHTRAGEAIFYMLDGVYIAREDDMGRVAFCRTQEPAEA
jgi:hypothetical protein